MQALTVFVACLLFAVVVLAQPSLVIQKPAQIVAGINPPPQEICLKLPVSVPPAPGARTPMPLQRYPLTVTPTASAGLSVVPSSIVLNDANNFCSSYQIVVGAPPTFGTNGATPQPYQISWGANSDFAGYANLDTNSSGLIVPRDFELCTTDGCIQRGSRFTFTLIQYVPSAPITIRPLYPPPAGTSLQIDFNSTAARTSAVDPIFQPASGLTITADKPWATFTILTDAFTNSGTVSIIFKGSASPYYFPAFANAIAFTSQLIPVLVRNVPSTMLVGVPYQITVALDIPAPVYTPPVTLVVTPMTSGAGSGSNSSGPAALNFSPSTLTFSGTTVTQTFTVTAPSVSNFGPGSSTAQLWFTLNPSQYDSNGPFTISQGSAASPLAITVLPRSLTWDIGSADVTPSQLFVKEPFPINFQLPARTPTDGGLVLTLAGSASGQSGVDLFSFDRTTVTFSGSTRETVMVTLNTWPRLSDDVQPFNTDTQVANLTLTVFVSGADVPLYSNFNDSTAPRRLDIKLTFNRRSFIAALGQYQSSPITLSPGVPSQPITVTVTDPNVLGPNTNLTLTPYVNTGDIAVNFQPSTLTFGAGVTQQSVRVTVVSQPRADGFAAPFSVSWALGGTPANMALFATPNNYAISNFPSFQVQRPKFTTLLPGSNAGPSQGGLVLLAGEQAQIVLSVDYAPSSDVTVTPFMPEAIITPSSATINATGSLVVVFSVQATAFQPTNRTMEFFLSGSDAAYFDKPGDLAVSVSSRSIQLPNLNASASLGAVSDDMWISVNELPSRDITVTPVAASPAAGIVFTPASVTFRGPQAPEGPSAYSQSLRWTGAVPGSFMVNWVVSGTDAAWYALSDIASQSQTVSVGLRPAPVIGLSTAASPKLTAGYVNGPITITLSVAPDADLTVTPTAADWVFNPSAVTFAAGQKVGVFSATFKPASLSSNSVTTTTIFYQLSGSDSWKYQRPGASVFTAQAAELRSVAFQLNDNLIVGVPAHGSISLPTHPSGPLQITPSAAGVVFDPAVFNFDVGTMTVHFTATPTAAPVSYAAAGQQPDSLSNTIPVMFTISGADAAMYTVPSDSIQVSRRRFLADVRFGNADNLRNPASGYGIVGSTSSRGSSNEFIVGRSYSNVMTITTVAPATSAVTLTPTCPYITFAPATLTFSPDVLSGSLSMTPTSVPPQGVAVTISWVLGGADELLFETAGLPVGNVNLLPNVVVSAIPAIWIDGVAQNLTIGLAPGQAQALANSSAFVMSVQPVLIPDPSGNGQPVALPCVDCVVIEPNTFVFSGSNTANKTFQIRHVRPMGIPAQGYHLNWQYRDLGSAVQNALQYPSVAIGGSTVRVLRYQIVPDFPFTLGYRNCKASINITRPPLGTVTITPGLNPDNQENEQLQSVKAAGGRVVFDPPQLVFPPGKNTAFFNVRIDRRIDEAALYYRVDYSIQAHPEDAACYLPFQSTWHVGSASAKQIVLALALLVPLVLALL